MSELSKILERCVEIPENRNYWFMRTVGGSLYDHFISKNLVAIGYNKITKEDLLKEYDDAEKRREFLKNKVKEAYPDHGRPGLIVSQLINFQDSLKKGDVVIIPNKECKIISIGIIENDEIFETEPESKNENIEESEEIKETKETEEIEEIEYAEEDYFKKSKSVRWISHADKKHYSPYLYQVFSTHQTMSNVKVYSEWIDSIINDFFKKGDQYHFVIRVNTEEKIKAFDLFSACVELLNLSDKFLLENNEESNIEKISTKVNLNSPGSIELICAVGAAGGLFAFGMFLVALVGGKFKINLEVQDTVKADAEISSDGLITKANEFLNSGANRKIKEMLSQKCRELNLLESNDIKNLLEQTDKKNQNQND
jgi:hypothetical protein